ncbi:MAG: ABC transporter substrate-binding protein [Sneathiella sp.]|nr:ABC transporter substrate-binding protein [Sneathiella sp.]
MKRLIGAALVMFGMMATAQAGEACGKVTIADMNWSSATVIAHVDKFILEHGYGCEAELIPGDTMPTTASMMEKGEPDIAPELWSNSAKDAIAQAVKDKRLRIAGKSLSDGGEEGFWVPEYMVKKDPSLATIEGILANAKLFSHPEDDSKSGFYTCPAGWNCQISANHLFDAMKMADAGFEIVDPGSSAGLSGSIAKAFTREEGWLGYYWAPTAVLGKYKMVKVDFGSGIKFDHFTKCLTQEVCENPQASMYPPSPVDTITTEAFAVRAPAAFDYLSKRSFKNDDMNTLLAWMEDNQAEGDVVMEEFLKNYESIWTPWLSAEVVAKVKKALAAL